MKAPWNYFCHNIVRAPFECRVWVHTYVIIMCALLLYTCRDTRYSESIFYISSSGRISRSKHTYLISICTCTQTDLARREECRNYTYTHIHKYLPINVVGMSVCMLGKNARVYVAVSKGSPAVAGGVAAESDEIRVPRLIHVVRLYLLYVASCRLMDFAGRFIDPHVMCRNTYILINNKYVRTYTSMCTVCRISEGNRTSSPDFYQSSYACCTLLFIYYINAKGHV